MKTTIIQSTNRIPQGRAAFSVAVSFCGIVCLALALPHSYAAPAAEVGSARASDRATGVIRGAVSNAATGAYLEGARVTLEPGNVSALTTRDGGFVLSNVAPGGYTLTISYTGLDSSTIPVNVRVNEVSVHDVALTAEIYKMSTFVVEGEREGNALAITQQRHAPNVKNVISSDAFGNVADLNIGNFLQRIPGFSTEMSEGEIIRVQIRGTAADLSAVTVDGTRAANGTTRTYDRAPDIDRMSADFIETIEVIKGMTPDIDADSIGGAVNLKTKSALDRKGRRITYNFGQNYNVAQKTFRPLANVGYSDQIMGGRLGVLLTASYNESHKPRDNNTVNWEATTATDRPAWFSANSFGRDQLRHKRAGTGFRVDYKLSEITRLYVNTSFSLYEDQLNRRWVRLSNPTAANLLRVTETVTEARNQTFSFTQLLRNRDVKTGSFMAGGESTVWGGKLDFNGSYSRSKGTDLGRLQPVRTVAGTTFRQERIAPNNGLILTQLAGPDVLDVRNSLLNSINYAGTISQDRIAGAQVNYRKPLQIGNIPLAVKTGARFRDQMRDRDNSRDLYAYLGPNGVAGPVGAANDDALDRFFDLGFDYKPNRSQPKMAGLDSRVLGQFIDLAALTNEVDTSPHLFRKDLLASTRDSLINDSKVSESVSAAYIMGDARLGRLGVVGGVRVEETRLRGTGYKQEITPAERARRAAWVGTVTPDETVRRTLAEYANPVKGSARYRDFFPSIHFRYAVTRALLARASFSTGIGRPNFGQIVPTMSVNHDTMTMTANNPSLKPQYSNNFDATLEYYFEPAGMLSVAGFEKRLTDFIFRRRGGELESANPFGEEYTGYTLTSDFNGGKAQIRGLEASYQQQFTNLPGFWRGFGAYLNYTWLESTGDYGTPGAVRTQSELPNFQPRSGNIGITYTAHGWTVRVMANYASTKLLTYSDNPAARLYTIKSTPVDLNLAYAFNRRLKVYLDVINVFNVERQNTYTFIPDRKTYNFVYTPVAKFGISGTF